MSEMHDPRCTFSGVRWFICSACGTINSSTVFSDLGWNRETDGPVNMCPYCNVPCARRYNECMCDELGHMAYEAAGDEKHERSREL